MTMEKKLGKHVARGMLPIIARKRDKQLTQGKSWKLKNNDFAFKLRSKVVSSFSVSVLKSFFQERETKV